MVILEKATRELSRLVKPMLLYKAEESLISEYERLGYVASCKADGVRVLMIKEDNKIILAGISGYTYENKFPEIVKACEFLPDGTILDGEVCCKTFQQTQSRTLTQDKTKLLELEKLYPATYFIFDILAYDYEDLVDFSLTERLEYLGRLNISSEGEIVDSGGYKAILKVENTPKIQDLWEKAQKEKWEGIVLKDPNSVYEFKRSKSWLKLKCLKSKDLIFNSYTINNAGVRAVSVEGIVTQVSGRENSQKFLDIFEKKGKVKVEVEYLEEFESGMLRQPICKEVKS